MLDAKIIKSIQEIVGKDNASTLKEDLITYSYDATTNQPCQPDIVVFPTNSEQVSRILKIASNNAIPVTARGAGTNLSGGSIPLHSGIVLCLTRMNKILDINKNNLTVTVEPGVVLQDLNNELARQNLFYPPDPQSFLACTIGGTIAENAGGPNSLKYGVTKQYILGMEVVLASGDIVKLGGVTAKNRTGYELIMLFTGSEGTLGIITRVTLRLLPKPQYKKTALAVFDNIANAGAAVSHILSKGIIPSKIEFMDNWFLRRIEQMTSLGLPVDAGAILLFETDGNNQIAVNEEANQIIEICRNMHCKEAKLALDDKEANMLWEARRAGFAAIFSTAPTIIGEDITVPRDQIALYLDKVEKLSNKYNVPVRILGHAGDGNIHPAIPTNFKDVEHFKRASQLMDEMFESALSFGGVLSGEHGIGIEKKRFLKRAMDPIAIELMQGIKNLLDPKNILNPGKIWEG